MINVAAIRMQQFGVQFYQASLTASDIDKLVRFEVLNYGDTAQPGVRGGKQKVMPGAAPSKVNWDLLERRIASSEKAYQRQIIRRKIDELVQYYEQCRQARDLPSIPGAVIISCDEKLSFQPAGEDSRVGILKVPEREGILRAIDGQHRLLALHADIDRFAGEDFSVPAIIFDRLPEDHVVQMFVTINAKHTRLNASHLVSLSGRQLYRDENLATAHDVVRALNDREDSPLYDEIKLLGVGRGRVAQAPLAQELKKLFSSDAFTRATRRRSCTRTRRSSSSTTSSRSRWCSAARGTAASTASDRPRRCAPSSAWRPTWPGGWTRSTPIARTSAPSAASSRRGDAVSATCGSRPTAPGSAPARPWIRWRRSCGSRCSTRRGPSV